MRTLTFNKNFGSFKKGETYDIEKDLTANFFVSNAIASEEIVNEGGCIGCKAPEIKEEVSEKVSEVVEVKKENKSKKSK